MDGRCVSSTCPDGFILRDGICLKKCEEYFKQNADGHCERVGCPETHKFE